MSIVLTNTKNIKEFLSIANKSTEELKAIAKAVGVEENGTAESIVDKLFETSLISGKLQPQAIPLSTRGNNPEKASLAMRQWRKKVFDHNKEAEFDMVSAKGGIYKIKAHFVPCSKEEARTFLENQWYLSTPLQRELLDAVHRQPEAFDFHIIRKVDAKGNQWLMLHARPKTENHNQPA
jgi:hypothetical protein